VLASPKLYGKWLNRSKGFKPVLLALNLIITLARQTLPAKAEDLFRIYFGLSQFVAEFEINQTHAQPFLPVINYRVSWLKKS